MTAPHNKRSPHGRRAMANYMHLGRTAMESHYRMAVDNLPQGEPYPSLGNFDTKQAWAWIKNWVKATYKTDIESIFIPADRRHSFDPYPATGEQGHYDLKSLGALNAMVQSVSLLPEIGEREQIRPRRLRTEWSPVRCLS
jgi:hypothetical protein